MSAPNISKAAGIETIEIVIKKERIGVIDTEASGTTNMSQKETKKIPNLKKKMIRKKKKLKNPTIRLTVAKSPNSIGNTTNMICLRKGAKRPEKDVTNREIA